MIYRVNEPVEGKALADLRESVVIFEASLRAFYRRFGFLEMLSGQLETYASE